MFNTSNLRALGGFPNKCQFSVDRELAEMTVHAGYKWILDDSVVSIHIRDGVRDVMKRDYISMMRNTDRFSRQIMFKVSGGKEVSFRSMLRSAATSPIQGMHIALKTRVPNIFFVYPYIRLMTLKNFIHRPWAH
jgi:hypothetical protein